MSAVLGQIKASFIYQLFNYRFYDELLITLLIVVWMFEITHCWIVSFGLKEVSRSGSSHINKARIDNIFALLSFVERTPGLIPSHSSSTFKRASKYCWIFLLLYNGQNDFKKVQDCSTKECFYWLSYRNFSLCSCFLFKFSWVLTVSFGKCNVFEVSLKYFWYQFSI